MPTRCRSIFVGCLGVLTIVSLPTPASADAVRLVSGKKDAGSVKLVGEPPGIGGSRSVIIDNGGGLVVTEVSITFPKNVQADCKTSGSCAKTNPGGVVTLTWSGATLGTDVNDPKKKQTFLDYLNPKDDAAKGVKIKVTYSNGGSISTTADTQVVKDPPPPAKKLIPTDAHKSIVFDAANGTLAVDHDVFLPTAFPGDPLSGADLLVPVYQLIGPTSDPNIIAFETQDQSQFFLAQQGSDVLMQAAAPFLFYDIAQNEFDAPFHLPKFAGMPADSPFFSDALPDIFSPSLMDLAADLNPTNAAFLPDVGFGTAFLPDGNFYDGSHAFTASLDMGAVDYLTVETPEPATLWLLGGMLAPAVWRKRAHRSGAPRLRRD